MTKLFQDQWERNRLSRRRFIAGSTAAAAGAAALLTGCSGETKDAGGEVADSPAETKVPSPGATPVLSPANFERAAQYSLENGGVGTLVMQGRDVVFERYATAEQTHRLASGTKTFCGAIAVAAVEDGILSGFGEKVSDTITEWKSDKRDPGKATVTVRHLLSLTAGLEPATSLLQGSITSNKYMTALDAELLMTPGTAFIYGPSSFFIFGELMRRKLAPKGEDARRFGVP